MADVIKSPTIIALRGKLESTYAGGGTLSSSTDGIQLAESPKIAMAYGFDGARPAPPGTTGYQKRAAPNGRTATVPFKVEIKGAGAAYSSSVKPSIDVLLRIMGFDAALTTTGGAEKYVYTPTPGPVGYASALFDAYARGELYPLTGALADGEIGGDDTGVVFCTANIQALLGAISDQITPPTITYPLAAIAPMTAVGAGLFTLGTFTSGVLRKWSLKLSRGISPRLNQNTAGGHAGFAVGRRTWTLDVTYETPTLATTPFHTTTAVDPYKLYDAATELATSIQLGSVQYFKSTWAMPKAQIMAPPVTDEDGDVVVTSLSLQLNPSAANANDELTATFD